MDLLAVEQKARQFLDNAKGHHDWEHVQRVLRLALHIGEKEGADLEVLQLAVLLHDVARPLEFNSKGKICHAKKSSEIARRILNELNYDSIKVEAVCHCIESHRYRNDVEPTTIEAKVLFDADKLDQIGAVGIGRAFLFAGEIGAKLHNPEIEVEKTKSYSIDDTAYREFVVKLRKVKDKMFTSEGKRIALNRHNFMVDFFERLTLEANGLL